MLSMEIEYSSKEIEYFKIVYHKTTAYKNKKT